MLFIFQFRREARLGLTHQRRGGMRGGPLHVEFPRALYHVTDRGNALRAGLRDLRGRGVFLAALAYTTKEDGLGIVLYCPNQIWIPGLR